MKQAFAVHVAAGVVLIQRIDALARRVFIEYQFELRAKLVRDGVETTKTDAVR